ncbi:hypothetical protein NFI96_007463 [Prochilodus magdalenae]|nr:hypothetical protein NFI96_007463 [Prochilodus magdalenae]
MKKRLTLDVQQYHRRLLLSTYFRYEEDSEPPLFTHKSNWTPKLSQVPNTVKGTAMGKRFAPSYANIFMARWEEKALAAWHTRPLHYFRFLDDIWGVWSGTEDEFEQFAAHLNRFNRSIKIKYTLHQTEVNFLDTVTYKGQDFPHTHKLNTRVYFKETDTHALLFKTSYHPKHTFRGIVKSQLLRFHRICTQPGEFWDAKAILFRALRQRGYSRSFLRDCLRSFRTKKVPNSAEMIPLITTFSKGSVLLNRSLKANFDRFMAIDGVLDHHRVISAYRKNPNLGDLLVRSRLPQLQRPKKKPSHLPEFRPKRWISNPRTKDLFPIWPPVKQEVSNCVYLVYCIKCHMQYVGETRNTMATRREPQLWRIQEHDVHPRRADSNWSRSWAERARPYDHTQPHFVRPYRREPQHYELEVPGARNYLPFHQQAPFPKQGGDHNFWKPQSRSSGRAGILQYEPRSSGQNRRGAPGTQKKQKNKQRHKKTQDQPNIPTQNTQPAAQHNTNSPEYKKFTALVRQLYNLLRSHHHLEKVADPNSEPPTFSRLTHYLSEVVKPANMTPLTKTLLEGNAKNWAYTTRLILLDHYKAHIEKETEALRATGAEGWEAALKVAIRWYQRGYPKKHSAGPIKTLETFLKTLGQVTEWWKGREGSGNTPVEEGPFTEEDFPPLPQRVEASPPRSTPWIGLSPFPVALPPRPPKKTIKEKGISTQGLKENNPAVVHPEDHSDLFQIELCPMTQGAAIPPLIHEPRAETGCKTPAVVEVHAEYATSPQMEEANQGPPATPIQATGVVPESPIVPQDNEQGDILSVLDPLASSPREEREVSRLSPPSIEPVRVQIDPPATFRPVKHPPTKRKLLTWAFKAHKPICIIGDSNLARIPEHNFGDVQIDSYPGGTFRHAENFINKAKVLTKVETVVLAFGLNHRAQKGKETAVKQMQRAIKAAVDKFPGAAIWIPIINYSKNLTTEEQNMLSGLNDHIRRNMAFLPPLPTAQFKVTQDKIHWTPSCARAIFEHWAKCLNFAAL